MASNYEKQTIYKLSHLTHTHTHSELNQLVAWQSIGNKRSSYDDVAWPGGESKKRKANFGGVYVCAKQEKKKKSKNKRSCKHDKDKV